MEAAKRASASACKGDASTVAVRAQYTPQDRCAMHLWQKHNNIFNYKQRQKEMETN
jgi:hypothetical protein